MKFPSFRDPEDFLSKFSRFNLPSFKDLDKWSNRVVHNLLYYQTNYFVIAMFIQLVIGALHPMNMFYSVLGFCVLVFWYYYFNDLTSPVTRFKREHPMLIMLCGACLILYLFNILVICLFGVLLSILLTFIHASLRVENLKNKVATLKRPVSHKTPMGALLEAIGVEPSFFT